MSGWTESSGKAYLLRGNAAFERYLDTRTAYTAGAFFVPFLGRGMSVLDCGCGGGSITFGLADAVGGGRVAGIDLDAAQIERARERAAARGSPVSFSVANIYEIPFADASFDAVFAHFVLFHLRRPQRAVSEMRRVLRPGGVVGICDPDEGGTLLAPADSPMALMRALELRVLEASGSNPYYARNLRQLMSTAGFRDVQPGANVWYAGTTQALHAIAAHVIVRFTSPLIIETLLKHGWADKRQIERLCDEVRDWAVHPDAFYSRTNCWVVGRV